MKHTYEWTFPFWKCTMRDFSIVCVLHICAVYLWYKATYQKDTYVYTIQRKSRKRHCRPIRHFLTRSRRLGRWLSVWRLVWKKQRRRVFILAKVQWSGAGWGGVEKALRCGSWGPFPPFSLELSRGGASLVPNWWLCHCFLSHFAPSSM